MLVVAQVILAVGFNGGKQRVHRYPVGEVIVPSAVFQEVEVRGIVHQNSQGVHPGTNDDDGDGVEPHRQPVDAGVDGQWSER